MRIVIAPDKFKGSLDARAVGEAIGRGVRAVYGDACTIAIVPMADGGEGTVDAFLSAGAQRATARVSGPLGEPVEAVFAMEGSTAILEMASASGLALLPRERLNAGRATTRGTGELIRAALDRGAERIVIGIGGSATTDGGAGMLQALGARLLDTNGDALQPGGTALASLASVDVRGIDPRLQSVPIEVAADVDNPLCGPTGASAVFGSQKGATATEISALDRALARFADVTAAALGSDRRWEPGTGAAGGLGFGLVSYFGARLRPGVEIVAELRGLGAALVDASLCITGEGRVDDQTLRGKTVAGVARLACAAGVPVVAIAGSVTAQGEEALAALGITVLSIVDGPVDLENAIAAAPALLERTGARLARLLALSGRLRGPVAQPVVGS